MRKFWPSFTFALIVALDEVTPFSEDSVPKAFIKVENIKFCEPHLILFYYSKHIRLTFRLHSPKFPMFVLLPRPSLIDRNVLVQSRLPRRDLLEDLLVNWILIDVQIHDSGQFSIYTWPRMARLVFLIMLMLLAPRSNYVTSDHLRNGTSPNIWKHQVTIFTTALSLLVRQE